MGTKSNPGKFDCYSDAESNEPIFVLLGRDTHAASLVRQWATQRAILINAGMAPESDRERVQAAMKCADEMEAYRFHRQIGKMEQELE